MIQDAAKNATKDKRAADAQARLRSCPYSTLKQVRCAMQEDVLVLTGVVPTFYAKQIAQEMLRGLDRIARIDNQLVVSN